MRVEAGLNDYTDFTPLPPGEYVFIIKEPMNVIPLPNEQTDIGTKAYNFVVYAEVYEGKYLGKRIRRRFSNRTKVSRYFLRTFLERIGVGIDASGSFASEDLLGKTFRAKVKERLYTDVQGNNKKTIDLEVESVIKLTDYTATFPTSFNV